MNMVFCLNCAYDAGVRMEHVIDQPPPAVTEEGMMDVEEACSPVMTAPRRKRLTKPLLWGTLVLGIAAGGVLKRGCHVLRDHRAQKPIAR